MRALCLLTLVACAAPTPVVIFATLQSAIAAADVKSFQLWALRSVGRDGLPLACEQLLARALVPGSDNVIALREPLEGNFSDPGLDIEALPADDGKAIFYIDLFDAPALIGKRVGAGCQEAALPRDGSMTVHLVVQSQ